MMSGSKGISNQKQLFKTKIVPGKAGSGKLFEEELVADEGPVECLGMTFENDEKRREYFLEKLRGSSPRRRSHSAAIVCQ